MTTHYKARIYFDVYTDDYEEGEGEHVNYWEEEIEKTSIAELKQAVIDATCQEDFSTFDDEQINNYDWCTEYHTGYLTDADNQGNASDSQIEEWKKGKLELYAVNCHVLVSKVEESKASL